MSLRSVFVSACVLLGCTHYQIEYRSADPAGLPPGMNVVDAEQCPSSTWHVVQSWRASGRDAAAKRAAKISSECMDTAAAPGQPTRIAIEGDAKLRLEGDVVGHGGDDPPRMLETFDFTDVDGTITIRDDGRTRVIGNVVRLQYWTNAVVIRLRDGSGLIVPHERVLGVTWPQPGK